MSVWGFFFLKSWTLYFNNFFWKLCSFTTLFYFSPHATPPLGLAVFFLPLPAALPLVFPHRFLREEAFWPCLAVLKVMHWESRKSSSLAAPNLMPAAFKLDRSSARERGWYCSTRPYSLGSDRMNWRTARSLSFSRTTAWDAVMPSLSESSSPDTHSSGFDLDRRKGLKNVSIGTPRLESQPRWYYLS